jgi:hypothetical protein
VDDEYYLELDYLAELGDHRILDEIPESLQTVRLEAFRRSLGIDRKTMRKWVVELGLPVIAIGSVKLVRVADAIEFLDAHLLGGGS